MEKGQPSWQGQLYQEGWISPRVYMGKTSPPTWAGSLGRVTRANYIYFPTKLGIRYLHTSFHFISYTQASPLRCVYMENFKPSQARSRQSIARFRQGGLALLSYKRKQILRRGISAKRVSPTNRAGPPPYKHPLSIVKLKC